MQVHKDIDHLPKFRNAVITIGTFDGVHTGHQQIIRQMREEAQKISGETVIITFDPHPRKIVNSGSSLKLLTTLEERIELLERFGVDHLIVTPFTKEFSELSAEEYLQEFLVSRFHPKTIIIGYDHRFGKGRAGDYKLLEKLAPKFGYTVREIPEKVLDEVAVSSTRIRQALMEGDAETANDLLGYEFFFAGKVVQGDKLGRELGYPTANIQVNSPEKIIPGNGIYAVTLTIQNRAMQLFKGMMSIGTRPTVNGKDLRVEVNIFNFDEEIYGVELRVNIISYIRKEEKFDGLETLKKAIAHDKIEVLKIFEENGQ
ncbi:MAG: riboflavin biosynthesis protein RibF [Bacteroidetes bacterium]|nr:MAG: riboflavin biosynthesis protein RibF [Bacteroidota bacterium]